MPKYTYVEKDECIACGACGSIAPDVFDFDDQGYAINILPGDDNKGTIEVAEDFHADVDDAAESCPTEAIKVADTPFS